MASRTLSTRRCHLDPGPPSVRVRGAQGLVTVGIASSRAPEELLRAGAVLAVPDMADPRLRAALAHMLGGGPSAGGGAA